jgi:lipopolysaccharide/colanic/teichoic acid biosynthesis glycosyltransferase
MSHPPAHTVPAPDREPWPEIDRLAPEAAVEMALCPTWYTGAKVMFDYLAAVLLLPLALPLIGLAALAVKITSPGPVFYTQTRVGHGGRRFKIVKVRTMHHNCELASGVRWAKKDDDRVFRIGRFLRVTHIDELPQLFNVLRGEMSLVGPRPERPEVIKARGLEQVVPGYRHRLLVKPGVTGLAQLQLPADSDLTSVRHKVVYDLYYVEHHGLLLDLRLVLGTLLRAAGAGPRLIRWVCLLPSRQTVADVFHRNVTPEPAPLTRLQPA